MNCRRAAGLLPDLLSGTLPPREATAVGEHVAGCPVCAEEKARLATVFQALDQDEIPGIEQVRWQTFLPQVRARLGSAVVQRRPSYSFVPALAAAAIVLALVGFWVFAPRSGPPRDLRLQFATTPTDSLILLAEAASDPESVQELVVERLSPKEPASGLDGSLDTGAEATDLDELLDGLTPAEREALNDKLERLLTSEKEVT